MAIKKNRSRKTTDNSGIGCLVGIAAALIVTGVILYNRNSINRLVEKDKGGKVTEKVAPPPKAAPASETGGDKGERQPAKKPDAEVKVVSAPAQKAPAAKPASQPPASQPGGSQPAGSPSSSQPAANQPASPSAPAAKPAKEAPPKETAAREAPKAVVEKPKPGRERTLWFMTIGKDGTLTRTKVVRSFPVTENPLVDVLTALLEGPLESEEKKGLETLIPERCRLLSASVRGSTAYLNFNEAFQFNPYGVEGLNAQLRQIVWTATEFDTVKDVQILIEGKKMDYLGAEGIFIGKPFTRESL